MPELKPRQSLRSKLNRTVLAGVALTVPFILTAAVLVWLGLKIDGLVRRFWAVPPGVGVVIGLLVGVAIFFVIGLVARLYLIRKLVGAGEWMVLRIPLARTLYEAARDLMKFFGGQDRQLGQVVRVSLAGGQIRMLGLLTNENPRGAGPTAEGEPRRVAVFLPMSYQIGGFTIYVRPDQVEPLAMSVEEAMRIAVMADVG